MANLAPLPAFRYVCVTSERKRWLRPASERMALVPWGVLVESETSWHTLHWASVHALDWSPVGVQSGGISSIAYSRVRVDTHLGSYRGRALGEAPLGGLSVHWRAYADEQAHALALDIDDEGEVALPGEAACESVWKKAIELMNTARLRAHLGLSPLDYRNQRGSVVEREGVSQLRAILVNRRVSGPDKRALACAMAGVLGVRELLNDLLPLIACPHPIIAALARHAARALGGAPMHTGSIEEVAPFLHPFDVDFFATKPS